MCDSRNCLEKGDPSEIKYLAVFQPQTLLPKVTQDQSYVYKDEILELWQKQNAKWKLLFFWISNNLWITWTTV